MSNGVFLSVESTMSENQISMQTTSSNRPKVLLADDHHLILDALRSMMKEEFDIHTVDSSQAFLKAVEDFKPDVAILDVSMPGADGFITARKVQEQLPKLPVVFLSM